MNELMVLTQIFTRIPIKKELDYSDSSAKRSSILLSFFGALIYLPVVAFSMGLSLLNCPAKINALLSVLLLLFITGAYHVDGFADTVDGMFSGRSGEKVLEIMKDSRIGAYGAIGIFMELAIKAVVFNELILTRRIWILPLLGAIGKLSLCYVAFMGIPAKEQSSGNYFINGAGKVSLIINTAVVLILGFVCGEILVTLVSIAVLLVYAIYFTGLAKSKIGGIVGDNLGFSSEIGELILGILSVWA